MVGIEGQAQQVVAQRLRTNSSISLPTCRVTPRTMAPAACSSVAPLAVNSSGLRKAANLLCIAVDQVEV